MSKYRHVNIFLGKYMPDSSDAWFGLDRGEVKIMRGREDTTGGWISDPDGEPWLMVDDSNFWPIMIRLTPNECDTLRTLGGSPDGHTAAQAPTGQTNDGSSRVH